MEIEPSAGSIENQRDFRITLSKNIRSIIPQQEKFENAFGRGQWSGYLKKLVGSNDVLNQFSKTPFAAGDTAWVKPALAKAREAKDLIRIAEKLDRAVKRNQSVYLINVTR